MINKIERNEIIDMIKGIGIVLMVSGHAKAPYTHFIYLFHMAIFFIASGFCYNTQNSKSVVSTGKYCLKKIKSIWFPYFVWMLIFSVLHNFFININVYTSSADVFNYLSGSYARVTEYWTLSQILKNIVKAFFFGGDITGLAGAFWFLAVLFEIVVAYNIVQFVLGQLFNRENQGKYIILSQTVVSVLFLIIGFICYLNEISMWGGVKKHYLIIVYTMLVFYLTILKCIRRNTAIKNILQVC